MKKHPKATMRRRLVALVVSSSVFAGSVGVALAPSASAFTRSLCGAHQHFDKKLNKCVFDGKQ
jgi:predicted ATPase